MGKKGTAIKGQNKGSCLYLQTEFENKCTLLHLHVQTTSLVLSLLSVTLFPCFVFVLPFNNTISFELKLRYSSHYGLLHQLHSIVQHLITMYTVRLHDFRVIFLVQKPNSLRSLRPTIVNYFFPVLVRQKIPCRCAVFMYNIKHTY